MNLSGKIKNGNETLPLANVTVTDSSGQPTSALKGTAADVNGNYSIDVNPSDYLTASYVGMGKKTVKVSDVCKQNSCTFDFTLGGGGVTLPEIVITPDGKPNWKRIALISGVSLIGVATVIYGIKYFRK